MVELQIARVKKGWTQAQLSKKSGVSRATIEKIEKDKKNTKKFQMRTLIKLSKALEITVLELLFYDYIEYRKKVKNDE